MQEMNQRMSSIKYDLCFSRTRNLCSGPQETVGASAPPVESPSLNVDREGPEGPRERIAAETSPGICRRRPEVRETSRRDGHPPTDRTAPAWYRRHQCSCPLPASYVPASFDLTHTQPSPKARGRSTPVALPRFRAEGFAYSDWALFSRENETVYRLRTQQDVPPVRDSLLFGVFACNYRQVDIRLRLIRLRLKLLSLELSQPAMIDDCDCGVDLPSPLDDHSLKVTAISASIGVPKTFQSFPRNSTCGPPHVTDFRDTQGLLQRSVCPPSDR